jgi:hypothetical protein
MADTVGFEPTTNSLEGYCSIQLSYAPKIWLFWKDSNLQPPQKLKKRTFRGAEALPIELTK